MKRFPSEANWAKVEQWVEQFGQLPPAAAAQALDQLEQGGESATIVHLVRTWLDLPVRSEPLSPGQRVGGFILRQQIGEGGMGTVWRAEQKGVFEREVALKMIHPALVTPKLEEGFEREVRILAKLEYPGIVRVYDAGFHATTDGRRIPFCAMELVRGHTLRSWVNEHRSDTRAMLLVLIDICLAIQRAHDAGIVHRDLKPENIMIDRHGRPVVLDFGIARVVGEAVEDAKAGFFGTPQYAAPEQHLGRDRDFRSGEGVDIYSLGVVAFEMLAGRRPFEFHRGTPIAEMRRAILEDSVPSLVAIRADLPDHVIEIVAKALRRNPADRYHSMAGLRRALDRSAARLDGVADAKVAWRPVSNVIIPGTRWRLGERLGEGGAGEVWRGRHEELQISRIFKFCESDEAARTLRREATLFRLLRERIGRNSHFVQLHEVSLDEPPYYLMMEDDCARDLNEWSSLISGGLAAVPVETRVEIVLQAAEAVQAAHDAGILHRDIKPANILLRGLSPEDALSLELRDQIHVLIADFGIGQLVLEHLPNSGTRLGFTHTVSGTGARVLAGSLPYLALEVAGGAPATVRSDVFSLGVVLWQLLVGDLHAALDPSDWAARITDPLLREDVRRCVAGDPQQRWASAGELAASLRSLQARREAASQLEAELEARERSAYRRGLFRAAGVATTVVVGVGLLAAYALRQRNAAWRSRGEMALAQAASLERSDLHAGRRERGLRLLDVAAATVDPNSAASLRSAAAMIFEMADLSIRRERSPDVRQLGKVPMLVPPLLRETARSISGSGRLLAVARERDDGLGAVDLFDISSGEQLRTIEGLPRHRIPVVEARLLAFESGDGRLAMGGGAFSRLVLVASTKDEGELSALFHPADPVVCAWHPQQPWLAVGCADGDVRVWNVPPGVGLAIGASNGQPSVLPAALLSGHRGPVDHIAFSPDGRVLVSLDRLGYLRVHSLSYSRMPGISIQDLDPVLSFKIEARLEDTEEIEELAYTDELRAFRRGGQVDQITLDLGGGARPFHLRSEVSAMAWSMSGRELCILDLTGVCWLDPILAESSFVAAGVNPSGAVSRGTEWLVVTKPDLSTFCLTNAGPAPRIRATSILRFPAATGESVPVAAVAVNARGDIAVYGGRRVAFLEGTNFLGSDLRVDSAGGLPFASFFWDRPGRILGAVYRDGSGTCVVSWKTSAEFPPKCERLNPMRLPPGELVMPAEDGQHLYARGSRGVIRLDPASAQQEVVSKSLEARQTGPFAVSPSGLLLAMVVDSSRLHLLSLPDGAPFATLPATEGEPVVGLSWQPSGQTLAIASAGGTVRILRLDRWLNWLYARRLAPPVAGTE